jgi:5'-phosphate synthase pdxT subunit
VNKRAENETPKRRPPRVGVLALQGDYDAHLRAVRQAGGEARPVRTPEEVADCDALVLPGGESTTIGKLLARFGLDRAIHEAHGAGKPIYGTCAGMILLAKDISRGEKRGGQPTLGLMDIRVARNAFGRQLDSFEADIDAPRVTGGDPVRGVFIRAPVVEEAGPGVEVLARYHDQAVLVRQNHLLASAFHPELTGDPRVHRYFLQMIDAPADDDTVQGGGAPVREGDEPTP